MSDETAPQPKARISWYLGTLAAFFFFVLIAAYASRITNNFPDDDSSRSAKRYKTLATVRQSENALLNPMADNQPTAEWADQNKNLIHVPIDQAMVAEVIDLKSKAPAAAAEIPATPPPAPAKTPNAPGAPAAAAPAAATTSAPAAPETSAPATNNAPEAKQPAGKKDKGAKK